MPTPTRAAALPLGPHPRALHAQPHPGLQPCRIMYPWKVKSKVKNDFFMYRWGRGRGEGACQTSRSPLCPARPRARFFSFRTPWLPPPPCVHASAAHGHPADPPPRRRRAARSNPECIAVGGLGHFAIWLDAELLSGNSGSCGTFGSPCLAHKEDFRIAVVELWHVQ